MTGPTWYDLLGVDRIAHPDQIREAWRSTIAELDPADPRFKSANRAAEVLLDPAKRTAYDEGLPEQEPEETDPAAPSPSPGPAAAAAPQPATPAEPGPRATSGPRGTPLWLLAVLVGLVVLLAVPVLWLTTKPSDAAVEDSLAAAQRAAERAMPTVLAYDHRSLSEDRAAARELLTPEYREKYDELFDAIEANAENVKPVVTAEVIASGVVRADHEAERVSVFLFVDQITRNARTPADAPGEVWRNSVTVTMVEDEGEWLLDGMETRSGGAAPTEQPTDQPTGQPGEQPSGEPSEQPSEQPSPGSDGSG